MFSSCVIVVYCDLLSVCEKHIAIIIYTSQGILGEIGGVKKLTQLNYEKGDRAPDTIYLTSVAEAGVDIVYVLTGQRIPSPVTVTPQNEEEKKLLENYRAMDEAARLIYRRLALRSRNQSPK